MHPVSWNPVYCLPVQVHAVARLQKMNVGIILIRLCCFQGYRHTAEEHTMTQILL